MRHFFFSAAFFRDGKVNFLKGNYSKVDFPTIADLLDTMKKSGIDNGSILGVTEFSTLEELERFIGKQDGKETYSG